MFFHEWTDGLMDVNFIHSIPALDALSARMTTQFSPLRQLTAFSRVFAMRSFWQDPTIDKERLQ